MTARRSLSRTKMVALFTAKHGICHICNGKIGPGEAWDRSHPIPLAMGGADDETNWDIAHRKCHRSITKTDVADIARAKRREAANLGAAKRSSRPMAGSRASGWKKRMDGTIERRT